MKFEQLTVVGTPISRRDFLKTVVGTAGVVAGSSALGGLVAACSPSQPASTTTVTMQLNWIKNVEFAGMWYALDQGFYKQEGLDITFTPGGGQVDPVSVVASGSALLGISSNSASVLLARAQNIPTRVFASQFPKSPGCLLTKASSGIRKPQDLIGKRIGLQQTARPSVEVILRANNIPIDKVTLVTVTADPSPLINDQIDALTSFATNQPLVLKEKGIEPYVMLYYDIGYKQEANPFFSTEDTFKNKKDLLIRFLRATVKGWQYTFDHTDDVTKLVVDKYGEALDIKQQTAENRAQLLLMQSDLTKSKGLFYLDRAAWDETNNILKNIGLIPNLIDLDQTLTWDILEAVHGKK